MNRFWKLRPSGGKHHRQVRGMKPEDNLHLNEDSEFNEIFENVLDGLENSARAEMVVGPAVTVGDVTLVPLIEVNINLGIGEKRTLRGKEYFSVGLGAQIAPSSVMVIKENQVYAISLNQKSMAEKIVENFSPESYNMHREKPDLEQ